MGSTANTRNGHSSPTPSIDQQLDDYAGGLQQMLDQELAKLADLRSQTAEVERVVNKIQQAIGVLKKPAPKTATPKATRIKTGKKSKYAISNPPSEEIVAAVRAVIESRPDGVSMKEVVEATGRSHDPVRRAIYLLRSQEVVRQAGTRPDSREHLFKMMPEHADG